MRTPAKLDTTSPNNGEDLTNQAFDRWTVLEYAGKNKTNMPYWKCQCKCGKIKNVRAASLKDGTSKSCGCLSVDIHSTCDGLTRKHEAEYDVYRLMLRRCLDPQSKSYKRYGERGITVCPEWQESFAKFLEDMGTRPRPTDTLERRDNSKEYSKDNCCWATRTDQARNTRRNRHVTYKGVTKLLTEWAKEFNLDHRLIGNRLDRGWTPEAAIDTPAREISKTITYQGKTLTLAEWSKELGISLNTINGRIRRGFTGADILSGECLPKRAGAATEFKR